MKYHLCIYNMYLFVFRILRYFVQLTEVCILEQKDNALSLSSALPLTLF